MASALDALEIIDADLGIYAAKKRLKSGWSLRMTIARLEDGGLLIISPTRGVGDGVYNAIKALGPVKFLLAPNHFHYLGLQSYLKRYPEAQAVSTDAARARIKKKLEGFETGPLAPLLEALPEEISLLEPEGLKNGESWLRFKGASGVGWSVGDAFFYTKEDKASGALGVVLKLTRCVPGLCVGSMWPLLHMNDKARYKAWVLAQIKRDNPTIMMPSHGEVIQSDTLAAELEGIVNKRV